MTALKTLTIQPFKDANDDFIFSSDRTAVVFKVRDTQKMYLKPLNVLRTFNRNKLKEQKL